MPQYMLVMKGKREDWNRMGPEETQRIMEKYNAYVQKLKSTDRFKVGSHLGNGVGLSASNGRIVVDGPYAETREVLNGYLILEAVDLSEATELAKECPALTHGETVEVFELN